MNVAGADEVNAAVRAAQRGQAQWAALTGAERARVLRRAAQLLRSRNQPLAELETRDTGKPIQETLVVDVVSGADCLEYFASLAQSLARRAPRSRTPGVRLYAPGASGRRRRHRRMELPLADRLLEGRARARLRQCHDLQAGGAHAAQRGQARGDLRGGRAAGRRVPGGAGFRRNRAPAHPASRHSQGVADRGSGHRQGGHERLGADPEERDAGARRQIPADRVRRRQAGQCRFRRAARQLLFVRPGVLERAPGYSCTRRSRPNSSSGW